MVRPHSAASAFYFQVVSGGRCGLVLVFCACLAGCDDSARESEGGVGKDANDAVGADATSPPDAAATDIPGVPAVIDPCPVLDYQTCTDECVPVYSIHTVDFPCSIAGVFMGCTVPPRGNISLDVDNMCAVLRSDPDHRFYCLDGDLGVPWFHQHTDLFCVSDPPCPGEPMPGCIK